ncbi:hypothetical protein ACEZDB_30095 [Streptacidiphilus sp. N1-3]|uniref:Lipoprotein n=1 Tax=Streptacidiphilus alkalitolerans TaxID=3342712 RepID=A0ABV6X9G5_9ACTN
MRRTSVLLAGTAAVLLAAGCAAPGTGLNVRALPSSTGSASARPCVGFDPARSGPLPTASGTPMNTPQAEALAQALDPKGDRAFADVYGTMAVDSPPGRVLLCVTDLARGREMAAAAKKEHPGIDLGRLDLELCRYSQRALDAVIGRMSKATGTEFAGFPLYSWSPNSDMSGIVVTTTRQGANSKALLQQLTALSGGTAVTVAAGAATVMS